MFPFGGILTEVDPPNEISLPGNAFVFDFGIWPGTVTAGFEVQRDGTIQYFDSSGPYGYSTTYWMESTGRTSTIGDLYEVRVVDQGGSDTLNAGSDTLSVWHQMSTLRSWWYSSSSKFVFLNGNFDVQIREIANPSNITNVMNLHLDAEQEL